MKKLSPPRTERFNPLSRPPVALVSIVTSPVIAAMAPASTFTSAPGPISTVPKANAGPDEMLTSIRHPPFPAAQP
jgi:hypothetical protein